MKNAYHRRWRQHLGINYREVLLELTKVLLKSIFIRPGQDGLASKQNIGVDELVVTKLTTQVGYKWLGYDYESNCDANHDIDSEMTCIYTKTKDRMLRVTC